MIVFGAMLMKDAPNHPATTTANGVVENDFTLAESMRKPQYWMLAVMFLTACMSGLYVIGVAKDIAQGMVHLDVATAANAVTVISIANLSGRLVLGILSDKISRIRVITIGQVVSLVGMAALLFAPLNAMTFFAAIACVAFNFGGTITVFPSLVSEFFGLNNLAKNYGVIYLGFGIGSICGSLIASAVRRLLCHLLRHLRSADFVAGALHHYSPAEKRNLSSSTRLIASPSLS